MKPDSQLHHIIGQIKVQKLADVYGRTNFEAYAYLSPELGLEKESSALNGECDGTGTSPQRRRAIDIAVTEALERWAFYECNKLSECVRKKIGLDIEPTTNGFAADPRFAFLARRRAMAEAAERWAICNWWSGYGGTEIVCNPFAGNFQVWKIQSPNPNIEVILAFSRMTGASQNLYAYGFAASSHPLKSLRIQHAMSRALTELNRNRRNLVIAQRQQSSPSNLRERRMWYFSSDQGHKQFMFRLHKSALVTTKNSAPRLAVDGEVGGPWNKWVKVWRCLYDRPELPPAIANSEFEFEF